LILPSISKNGTLIDEIVLYGKRLLGRNLSAECINIGVNIMTEPRSTQIVSLISAAIVFVAGIYVIFFMPFEITPTARVLLALVLIVYLIFRIQYLRKHIKKSHE